MSAPAAHISEYTTVETAAVPETPYRALSRPPDLLEKLYQIARETPPLIAITSLWLHPQWRQSHVVETLLASTFTLRHLFVALLLMFVWARALDFRGREGRNSPRLRFLGSQLVAVLIGTAACTLLLWACMEIIGPLGIDRTSLTDFALRSAAIGAALALLAAVSFALAYCISAPRLYLILGSRHRAISAYKRLQGSDGRRGVVLGFVDPDASYAKYLPCDYLGSLDQLESILVRNPVNMVCLAMPLNSHYHTMQEAIRICERIGVDYDIAPDIFQTRFAKADRPLPRAAGLHHVAEEDYHLVLKRVIDVVAAALLLLAISPLMLIIAIAVKLSSEGPVFFVQERYGRNRKRFRIYKFRSMVADAEELMKRVERLNEAQGPIFKIRRDPRITKVGRILRRASLDELPQLWNVLKGDMSLVGPRPMSLRDVHRFSEASLMRRFSVVPGITGLWQVSGRSDTDFNTWIRLDLEYIDQWSLGLDLQILLRTVPCVLSGRGAV